MEQPEGDTAVERRQVYRWILTDDQFESIGVAFRFGGPVHAKGRVR
jgi:hypothetical protein